MTFHATEQHNFGTVSLSCESSPTASDLLVHRVECETSLPNDETVDAVSGYLIETRSSVALHNFSFDLVFLDAVHKGEADSGERLDAQSWRIGNGLLMIGTEDGDSLNARMPWFQTVQDRYPIEYLPNGFRLSLDYIPPKRTLSLHFVLAYNVNKSNECSEYFAVKIPHANFARFPVVSVLAGQVAG